MVHQTTSGRYRYFVTHIAALSVAIGAGWVLQASGLLQSADHLLYDQCLSAAAVVNRPPEAVVLVSAPADTFTDDARRRELVSALERLDAAGIAWTQPHPGATDVSDDRKAGAWVIAPEAYFDALAEQPQDSVRLSAPEESGCQVGYVLTADGVHREQSMVYVGRDGRQPSLAAAIASRWHGDAWSGPQERFRIRFRAARTPLPTIPADVVLSEGLVSEVIRGRVVLIGGERTPEIPGLAGPLTAGRPMTPLEFHGEAANSLLTESWIRVASPRETGGMILFGAGLVYLLCVRFPQHRRRLLAILLGGELIAGWLTLTYSGIWLPLGFLSAAQLLAAGAASFESRWSLTDLVSRLAFRIRSRLLRQTAARIHGEGDPWQDLAGFARRVLAVSELAVYECTGHSGKPRVWRCGWRQGEQAEGGLDESAMRTACAALDLATERQRLVSVKLADGRIGYASRVNSVDGRRGQLILIPAAEEGVTQQEFESELDYFLDVIEERAQNAASGCDHTFANSPDAAERRSGRAPAAELTLGVESLEFELDLFQQVLEASCAGVAIFDAYGNRLHENGRLHGYAMDRLGDGATTTLEDMLAELMSSEEDARKVLRQLLLHHKSLSLSVPRSDEETSDEISLRPLDFRWSPPLAGVDAASVVTVRLILCEWSLTKAPQQSAVDEEASLLEMTQSLQTMIREQVEEPVTARPAASNARARRAASSETWDNRSPLPPLDRPAAEDAPAVSESLEAVHE